MSNCSQRSDVRRNEEAANASESKVQEDVLSAATLGESLSFPQTEPNRTAEAGTPDRRPRKREERGLPDGKTLRELATSYLETQHHLWPELAEQGVLPPVTPKAAKELARDFKDRFLGKAPLSAMTTWESVPWEALAAGYLRYSSDNSNPRSLAEQLRLELERARANNHFIPWSFVFADAAVTGTTANRHGYEMAKDCLANNNLGIETLYVDEIGRASRDTIETLMLGRFIEKLGKRLIGVSDAFDSHTPTSKFHLTIFAALHEWFIDQLRAKVNRGRRDAFDRGTNLGRAAIGHKLIPAVDGEGRLIFGKDGDQLKMKVIDDKTAPHVRLAFELYGERHWPKGKIAQHFNELGVGRMTWDLKKIDRLLTRRAYVGISVDRMTYLTIDPETGGLATKHRPRQEWRVRRARHLQIVSRRLWKKVQVRLADCRKTYAACGNGAKKRTDLYPKTLIRPICGSCGKPMWLGRGGRNASFKCLDGRDGKRGCSARGYKSVRIVEEAIVRHLQEEVFTEERIEQLVMEANRYLKMEAAKPRIDTGPIEAEIKKLKATRDRLAKVLESEGEHDLGSLVTRLRSHERRLRELNDRLREVKSRNDVPPPIERADMERMLQDLRGLLNEDVAVAAPIIQELTGPIVAHQKPNPGKRRPTWHAEFTVNLLPAVVTLAAQKKYPSRGTLEHLSSTGWTLPAQRLDFRIEAPPSYEKQAHKFKELHDQGRTIISIAREYNRTRNYVTWLIRYATTGQKPW